MKSQCRATQDLTNGEVPTSNANINLGPTGLHGWLYHTSYDTSQSPQILVTALDAGSPADGALAVDDVILGADGTGANPVNFSSDARRSLADAIADAKARNPATLKLIRWRAGSTSTVEITLQTLGAYSATAPHSCPNATSLRRLEYVHAHKQLINRGACYGRCNGGHGCYGCR